MDTVNILTTNLDFIDSEPFEHNGRVFVFSGLSPDYPLHPIDGQCWAFIDWVLESMSGLEFCRLLRSDTRWADAHISIVLEEDDPNDRRRALRAGADGYLSRPISRQILLDRVLSVTASGAPRLAQGNVSVGDLMIDPGAMQVRWKNQRFELRPNEYRLLRFFAENPNRLHTRQDLIAGLGKSSDPIDERTVDVWIGRLRRHLRSVGADDLLRTVRSRGYVFEID